MRQLQLLLLAAILVVLGFIARDLHRLAWEFGPLGAVSNGLLGAALKAPETREQRIERETRQIRDHVEDAGEIYRRLSAPQKPAPTAPPGKRHQPAAPQPQ